MQFLTYFVHLSLISIYHVKGQSIVPALIIFGDSIVDVGNNNNLVTVVKSNFSPYGRDFIPNKPTGRFCNGKLAIDFAAEYLGFPSYPPAYLSPEAKGKKLLIGANFASAASGLYDPTANLFGAITLTRQLNHYREYRIRVVSIIGEHKAKELLSKAIHLLSAGSSDFLQNYYINPLLNAVYSPPAFSDILMRSYSNFIMNLYEQGARRIGVTSLPPIGCLPAAITLFGLGSNNCVERLNEDAKMFNSKLNVISQNIAKKLPGLKLVVFNVYKPLLDLITNPSDNGFFETRKACCGTGTLEVSFLCNTLSIGTCSNATEYVFWDGFHPSESTNEYLAGEILAQGISLIS